MSSFSKFTFIGAVLCLGFLVSQCKTDAPEEVQTPLVIAGETMGTYYRVSYMGEPLANLPASLDSILQVINQSMSTYIPTSLISQFNQEQPILLDNHFEATFLLAKEINEATEGKFDPTVMPLVNYWGFGYQPNEAITGIDSFKIDSLLQYVGFDLVTAQEGHSIMKLSKRQGVQLDFSAIAKGYAVDELGKYMELLGFQNYFVDIGGEVLGKGEKSNNEPWKAGVAVPQEESAVNDIMATIPVKNKAIATSGNYRNFYEFEGQKYSHTINPKTGFPERSKLLSVSVMSNNCATSDAYATACMVAGLEEAYRMVTENPALEGYFIFSNADGELETMATPIFQAFLDSKTNQN